MPEDAARLCDYVRGREAPGLGMNAVLGERAAEGPDVADDERRAAATLGATAAATGGKADDQRSQDDEKPRASGTWRDLVLIAFLLGER